MQRKSRDAAVNYNRYWVCRQLFVSSDADTRDVTFLCNLPRPDNVTKYIGYEPSIRGWPGYI